MNILFVGGRWDDFGGKESGYCTKLFSHLVVQCKGAAQTFFNGGYWKSIAEMQDKMNPRQYDVVLWFADIPNDKPKLVEEIKNRSPYSILVTSKNNIEEKYSLHLLVARALKVKSNLVVEFKKRNGLYVATILDPLGNVFLNEESDIYNVARVLAERIKELKEFTRIPSIRIGDAIAAPDQPEFFDLARKYATVFHDLIHADTTRFLGNISFRCEHGFPSFRGDQLIFVSKRNVDKREISAASFVAVSGKELSCVHYFGDEKPSVDAPIQVRIYANFPKIRYMLHSHTYLEGAAMTAKMVPCGAIEELGQIMNAVPLGHLSRTSAVKCFRVNLRGHGSLVASDKVSDFVNLPYIARPMPEFQNGDSSC